MLGVIRASPYINLEESCRKETHFPNMPAYKMDINQLFVAVPSNLRNMDPSDFIFRQELLTPHLARKKEVS